MNNMKPEETNAELYQTRIYSIDDELVEKRAFTSYEAAVKAATAPFSNEAHGQTIARSCVRVLNPDVRGWLVTRAFPNTNAAFFEAENAVVDVWRYRFYSMGDELMAEQTAAFAAPEETIQLAFATLNAFYCTVSCHEKGTAQHLFMLTSPMVVNHSFHLYTQQNRPEMNEAELDALFEDTLQNDYAETQRIQKRRARNQCGEPSETECSPEAST